MLTEEGGSMPVKALKKFLEDVVKCELAQQKNNEKNLKKHIFPNSRFYKNYFLLPQCDEIIEEIVKVVRDIEKSPDKAEVIIRYKYTEGTYFRYTMKLCEEKWLISDYAFTCWICNGESCGYCKDGWIV